MCSGRLFCLQSDIAEPGNGDNIKAILKVPFFILTKGTRKKIYMYIYKNGCFSLLAKHPVMSAYILMASLPPADSGFCTFFFIYLAYRDCMTVGFCIKIIVPLVTTTHN